jgi:hypothetical protein
MVGEDAYTCSARASTVDTMSSNGRILKGSSTDVHKHMQKRGRGRVEKQGWRVGSGGGRERARENQLLVGARWAHAATVVCIQELLDDKHACLWFGVWDSRFWG